MDKKDSRQLEPMVRAQQSFDDVIRKHFKFDGKTLYFIASDSLRMIEGDVYLTWKKPDNERIELYFGCENGETCIKVCRTLSHTQSYLYHFRLLIS